MAYFEIPLPDEHQFAPVQKPLPVYKGGVEPQSPRSPFSDSTSGTPRTLWSGFASPSLHSSNSSFDAEAFKLPASLPDFPVSPVSTRPADRKSSRSKLSDPPSLHVREGDSLRFEPLPHHEYPIVRQPVKKISREIRLPGRPRSPGSETDERRQSPLSSEADEPTARAGGAVSPESVFEQQSEPETATGTQEYPEIRQEELIVPYTKLETTPRFNPSLEYVEPGKKKMARTKQAVVGTMIALNFIFIFATWWWSHYYYIYLPFITLTVALNCIMVFSVGFFTLKHKIWPEKKFTPEKPESMVFLMPCYNENLEECTKSLDSLVSQVDIDDHPRAIMIICDGQVRGPGMEKTTSQYLLEDILVEKTSRKRIRNAYRAWDRQSMDVLVQKGTYKGVPYYCIIKQHNQGKRDGLIVLRSFLYKYNMRKENPEFIFSQEFFDEMTLFLEESNVDNVDHLIGMDADTVFDDTCVSELLKQSRYEGTVGVCGYVAVDFKGNNWNAWSLYQSAEYSISQGLRRLHQSIVTNKVSCLPGCCQLLKICETTCGDHVLIELFGYFPTPMDDMLKQIRATASEDRNHVCLMLSARSKAKTRQALRARAYTDVPHSWSVFLSQRRRWTLGATSNDLMLITSPGIQWFERILAATNCTTWLLNPFIFASIASLIKACLSVPWWFILSFASVMIIPLTYYICIVLWLPRTWLEKGQYLCGCMIYIFCGPFINIGVLLYALWNMDSFGWGKTRKVVVDDEEKQAVVLTPEEEKESTSSASL